MTNQSKRHTLQRFALGLAGIGLAGRGETAAPAPDEHAVSWVHGHSTDIGFPDLLESATSSGGAKTLRGRSYSSNHLHFALSVPGKRTRVSALLLRYQTLQGASIRALRIFDGEREVAAIDDLRLQQAEWAEQRIALQDGPRIERCLSVTLEIVFDDVERELAISAVGAEFTA